MTIRKYVTALFLIYLYLLTIPSALQAGAWTLQQGEIWAKVSYLYQNSDQIFCGKSDGFCSPGNKGPYDPFIGGILSNNSFYLDVYYGLTENLTIIAKTPLQFLEYENDNEILRSKGTGDFRFSIQQQVYRSGQIVGAIAADMKIPTGTFENVQDRIHLGEGQWDFDGIGQIGVSPYPLPAYLNADIGFRVRAKNSEIDRRPGNELFYSFEAGFRPVEPIMLKLALTGLHGAAPVVQGVTVNAQKPYIIQLGPEVFVKLNDYMEINAAIQIPVKGENFPADNVFMAGLVLNMIFFQRGSGS